MQANRPLHSGIDGLVNSAVGFGRRILFSRSALRARALQAHEKRRGFEHLSEDDLTAALIESRARLRRRPSPDDVVASLGVASEAARRILGVTPYVEQLMGALAMETHAAVQMQTGEGKTITAAIAAVIAGWKGAPCHVVTSNDYLAKRDAGLMAPLFKRCGLTVGFVIGIMQQEQRKAAYACDITYSTSKELLADFLRDSMAREAGKGDPGQAILDRLMNGGSSRTTVMRGLHTAIIDEADSVLIDEATVPLIISLPNRNRLLHEAVITASVLADSLSNGGDYLVSPKGREVFLTASGREKLASAAVKLPAIWKSPERSEFLVRQALVARHCYHRDVHYVIVDGKIVIVDERTGRVMEGRSWSGGLHQAVEMKEGVELTDPTYSHTQMSFQLFFRLYRHLAGMSGTLQNVADELWNIYGLLVIRIPTHVPKQVNEYRERVFPTTDAKWEHVVQEITAQFSRGRPVLVGTRSIRDSEELHRRVSRFGIRASVLNAVLHEQEAAIIARAGEKQQVTIATNMAGRGTDILVPPEVTALGGLHVIATERHESRRVDMQLFGRTSRQGAPGTVQMLTCLEDDLVRIFVPPWFVRHLAAILDHRCGEWLAIQINRINQRRAEWVQARLRTRILLQDIAQSKLLSFANR